MSNFYTSIPILPSKTDSFTFSPDKVRRKHYQLPIWHVVSLLLPATATLTLSHASRHYSNHNLRRKTQETQRDWPEWCVNHISPEGFIMNVDADNCWTRNLTLFRTNANLFINTTNEIYLDIINELADKSILFLGDSIARYAMHAFRSLISNENPIDWKFSHESLYYVVGRNTSIDWKQAWPASEIVDTLQSEEYKRNYYDYVFLENGIHEVADNNESVWEEHVDNFTSYIGSLVRKDRFVFQTAPPINETGIPLYEQTPTLTDANVQIFNHIMVEYLKSKTDLPLLDGYWQFEVDDLTDGLHSRTFAFATAYRYAWYLLWKNELELQ